MRVAASVSQGGEECYRADFTFAILGKKAAEQLMGTSIPAQWDRFCR
ncbi:MAG: hypothetical protein HY901_32815 [Deltaproteobacteria bacterium]|nr:hypothetical protein [Deltaproteobacteria bacterium]